MWHQGGKKRAGQAHRQKQTQPSQHYGRCWQNESIGSLRYSDRQISASLTGNAIHHITTTTTNTGHTPMCGRLQVSDLHQSQIGYQQLNSFEALYVDIKCPSSPVSHTWSEGKCRNLFLQRLTSHTTLDIAFCIDNPPLVTLINMIIYCYIYEFMLEDVIKCRISSSHSWSRDRVT